MIWHQLPEGIQKAKDRPPLHKWVVVRIKVDDDPIWGYRMTPAYMKLIGGRWNSPHWVIPGTAGKVTAWADCLSDDFECPEDQQSEPVLRLAQYL